MNLTVVTINLQSGASDWMKRLPLLAAGLLELAPDVVAVQEVHLPADGSRQNKSSHTANPAEQLAESIGYPHLSIQPQTGEKPGDEAIAILSRLPFTETAWIDLQGQGRVAQRVIVTVDGQALVLANTHLFWQPGDSTGRLHQAERLIAWLDSTPGQPPVIVCGDFNGTPETRAIRRMKQKYASAYRTIHAREPERTFPTPLKRSKLEMLMSIKSLLIYVRPQHLLLPMQNTLDYIFVDPRLRVADCRLALDQPADGDPRLYPSDHYALWARVDDGQRI